MRLVRGLGPAYPRGRGSRTDPAAVANRRGTWGCSPWDLPGWVNWQNTTLCKFAELAPAHGGFRPRPYTERAAFLAWPPHGATVPTMRLVSRADRHAWWIAAVGVVVGCSGPSSDNSEAPRSDVACLREAERQLDVGDTHSVTLGGFASDSVGGIEIQAEDEASGLYVRLAWGQVDQKTTLADCTDATGWHPWVARVSLPRDRRYYAGAGPTNAIKMRAAPVALGELRDARLAEFTVLDRTANLTRCKEERCVSSTALADGA